MNEIEYRIYLEEKSYLFGFQNEILNILAADILQGIAFTAKKIGSKLPILPIGIHIARPLREAFFNAGEEIGETKEYLSNDYLQNEIQIIFSKFEEAVSNTISKNKMWASTGDCRGACKYNTGDSSEYRNYGW